MATKAGLLYSKEIEQELIEVGQSIPFESSSQFVKNSHLHIMTQAFQTGGHTRVCERWIEFSKNNEMHSILMTEQRNDPIPKSLERVVNEKRGSIYSLNSSPLVKIKEIREIASNYEKVILHIHADDQVTFIAFATTNFKRPVLFFNHLDHVFWIGIAISDMVVNLRSSAIEKSNKHRFAHKNSLLPLPIQKPRAYKKEKVASLKSKLKIPPNAKVAITLAATEKYTPIKNYDFVSDFAEILKKYTHLHLIAIGPLPTEERWIAANLTSGNRVRVIGRIPHEELSDYISLADLAIDSYPMSSFTALLDIASHGTPCLTLLSPFGTMDSVGKSNALCDGKQELLAKMDRILASQIEVDLYQKVKDMHFREAFLRNLKKVMKEVPDFHAVSKNVNTPSLEIPASNKFFIKIQLKRKYMKGPIKIVTTKFRLLCKF
jgi:hypothetical protein